MRHPGLHLEPFGETEHPGKELQLFLFFENGMLNKQICRLLQ